VRDFKVRLLRILLGVILVTGCTLKYKVTTPDGEVYEVENRNNTLITIIKPDGTKILVDNRWITIGIDEVSLEK
jgi:hypothetical protein